MTLAFTGTIDGDKMSGTFGPKAQAADVESTPGGGRSFMDCCSPTGVRSAEPA